MSAAESAGLLPPCRRPLLAITLAILGSSNKQALVATLSKATPAHLAVPVLPLLRTPQLALRLFQLLLKGGKLALQTSINEAAVQCSEAQSHQMSVACCPPCTASENQPRTGCRWPSERLQHKRRDSLEHVLPG